MVVEVIVSVSTLSSFLFLDFGGVSKALLIDLPFKGVSLILVDLGFGLEHSLFLMHFCLVLQDPLVYDLVLPLLSLKSLRVALVVLQLLHDCSPRIERTHGLIFDLDRAQLALVDQFLVLCVPNFTLLARLQLSITVFLNHGRICIEILSLEFNLFELLSQSLLLSLLIFLLFRYLFVYFNKTLVLGSFHLGFIVFLLFLLLGSFRLVFKSPKLTSLVNLSCLVHDLFDTILLSLKVVFPLGRYFLLPQHLIIL